MVYIVYSSCSRNAWGTNQQFWPISFSFSIHYTFDNNMSPPFFLNDIQLLLLTELYFMPTAYLGTEKSSKIPIFFLSGQPWKFLHNTLNTSNLITLIGESEMFASFCLSHLITPSSFPPREPVRSVAWGGCGQKIWGGEPLKCVPCLLLYDPTRRQSQRAS